MDDMDDKEDTLDFKKNLTPIDPKDVAEFERKMKEEAIPRIIKAVDQRRMSAAKSRLWQLKC